MCFMSVARVRTLPCMPEPNVGTVLERVRAQIVEPAQIALLDSLDVDPDAPWGVREISVALRGIRGETPDDVWQAVWDAHMALVTADREDRERKAETAARDDALFGVDDSERQLAAVFAMHVRNALEDFHVQHLDDDQMAQLNPIIRDAILEVLVMLRHSADPQSRLRANAELGLTFDANMIPQYWEPAQLSVDFRVGMARGLDA
jgi:hypothetical protein